MDMGGGAEAIPDAAATQLCEIIDVDNDRAIYYLMQTNGDISQAVAMHLSEERVASTSILQNNNSTSLGPEDCSNARQGDQVHDHGFSVGEKQVRWTTELNYLGPFQ